MNVQEPEKVVSVLFTNGQHFGIKKGSMKRVGGDQYVFEVDYGLGGIAKWVINGSSVAGVQIEP